MNKDQLLILSELYNNLLGLKDQMVRSICDDKGDLKGGLFQTWCDRNPAQKGKIKATMQLICALISAIQPYEREYKILQDMELAQKTFSSLEESLKQIQNKVFQALDKSEWANILSKQNGENSHALASALRSQGSQIPEITSLRVF